MEERQLYIKGDVVSDCSVIHYGGRFISNPSAGLIHAAGWVEWTPPGRTLQDAISDKIAEINAYDTSSAVNEIFIGGNPLWIDRETRAVLVNRFDCEKASGKTTTTLWDGNDNPYTLPIATAEAMLQQVELYAAQTYDVTAQHRAAVRQLTTIEDVDAFDITADYPEKLHFNI